MSTPAVDVFSATELKNLENNILSKLKYNKSSKEILKKLKLIFCNRINSKRTVERIDEFDQLFIVLKKRNAISYNKLKSFDLALNDTVIKGSFKQEKCNLVQEFLNVTSTNTTSLPTCGQHENILHISQINICNNKDEAAAAITSLPLQSHYDNSDLYKNQDFHNMVVMEISDKIGSKWRNLARYLDFKERIIDQVEAQHADFKERAKQILNMSLAQVNFENWKTKLTYALEKVRRRDLRDWIQDVAQV